MGVRSFIVGLAVCAGVLAGDTAQASSLSITDVHNGVTNGTWVLDINTACTTCTATLTVNIASGSEYYNWFVDAVAWDITNPNVTPTSTPTMTSTTAGSPSNWSTSVSVLNANGCGGGGAVSTCAEWVAAGAGFQITSSITAISWTFNAVFASQLTTLTAGNIRASFNTGVLNRGTGAYQNAYIFSPGGGSFCNTNCTPPPPPPPPAPVPEPASLVLVGTGLLGLVRFSRRMGGRKPSL